MLTTETPISQLMNVGDVYTKRLAKLNIKTVGGLIYHFPFRYEDYTEIKKIKALKPDETATAVGTILEIKNIFTKYGKKLTKAILADETGEILLIWFNQHYLTRAIKKNDAISISGKVGVFDSKRAFVSPEWEIITKTPSFAKATEGKQKNNLPAQEGKTNEKALLHTGRLVPVYSETYGVTSKWIRRQTKNCISVLLQWYKENDFLPKKIKDKYSLAELDKALHKIHFPENKRDINLARERLGFDEMFLLQLQALLRKKKWQKNRIKFKVQSSKFKIEVENFIKNLPFQLTNAQKRCISEIIQDLGKDEPMNRLLEGDVGSGKTVVAAIAVYLIHLNDYQSVFMAPTEILAKQHFATLSKLLSPYDIKIELVTGSQLITKTKKQKNKKTKIVSAQKQRNNNQLLTINNQQSTCVFVGTHALLYHPEIFERTAFVVIDEQHRFGVEQRARLLQLTGAKEQSTINNQQLPDIRESRTKNQELRIKGSRTNCVPHTLTMTATPIPRTLALTIYGDLDLSIIDEMPKDRLPVKTWVVPISKRNDAYAWIKKQIQNSKFKIQSVGNWKLEIGNLESKVPASGKFHDRKNNQFGNQVFIVCPFIEESETLTSVKAATTEFEKLEKIFAEFKLGLLHGRMKSKEKDEILQNFRDGKVDILVSTPVVEVGIDIPNASIIVIEGAERFGLASLHQLRGRVGRGGQQAYCLLFTSEDNPAAINRLKALEKYHNGPKLAEIDLRNRGMGELFGIKQHGFADLKIASFSDAKLITQTKEAAESVIDELNQHPLLMKKLEEKEKLVEAN